MFEIGQLIVYGNKGIYKVDGVGDPGIDWLKAECDYYTLSPIFREENIYIPVTSDVYMRPVMTKDAAEALIRKIPEINTDDFDCKNPRSMEYFYRTSLNSHDPEQVIGVIKHIYQKSNGSKTKGKRVSQIDEKYMRRAENSLYEELAVIYDIPLQDVPQLIHSILADINSDS